MPSNTQFITSSQYYRSKKRQAQKELTKARNTRNLPLRQNYAEVVELRLLQQKTDYICVNSLFAQLIYPSQSTPHYYT